MKFNFIQLFKASYGRVISSWGYPLQSQTNFVFLTKNNGKHANVLNVGKTKALYLPKISLLAFSLCIWVTILLCMYTLQELPVQL